MCEILESYLSDADNDPIPSEMYDMAVFDHGIHDRTAWNKEDRTCQRSSKSMRRSILMMGSYPIIVGMKATDSIPIYCLHADAYPKWQ